MLTIKNKIAGLLSFFIVLLLMPLGHILMVLIEKLLHGDFILLGAGALGFLGLFFLWLGIRLKDKKLAPTILGLIAGILVWTGWVEFSFVWISDKYMVADLMDGNEIATKAEYLIMPSSIGLLACILIFYIGSQSKCQFFIWFQKRLKLNESMVKAKNNSKPMAMIAFMETIIIIWTFYILLLLVYDETFGGDQSIFTHLVAYGSLLWSTYLILNLLKIKKFDYALRYAVPTVIIFWNFIEILGRWDMFKEIWVHPLEHWREALIMFVLFMVGLVIYSIENKKKLTATKA